MKRCTRCLYPTSKPDLEFTDGVCSACLYHEGKNDIDWDKRASSLKQILDIYRNDKYWDCVIPVSGGKDSHYITYILKEMHEMNPLLVSFIPIDQTPLGRKNLENIKKTFDVDCIEFYGKPSEYHALQRQGLHELGDHAYPEHLGIVSIPMLIADKFNIPLIVWAENPTLEYGGTPIKDDQFEECLFKKESCLPDSPVYSWQKFPYVRSIFLGDYIKWNAYEQVKLMKQYGFCTNDGPMEWAFEDYENLDTKFVVFHDYFKYLKYGYGRATDQASIAVHQGRMTREQGMKMVEKYDGKLPTKYLAEYLKEIEITREEFDKLCDKFRKHE